MKPVKKQAKILVADDDQMVRDTIVNILQAFGHGVVSVSDGSKVIDSIDDSFDVVVLDINMPGLDGFSTIEILNRLNLGIPVLFLTGAGSMDYAMKAINLGAYDFLTKPIEDLQLFNATINRAIEKRNYVLNERQYKADLESDIRQQAKELEEKNKLLSRYSNSLESATLQIMLSLQNAMEEKDYYTAGHSKRVTEYSVMVGKAMGLSQPELQVLRRAAQFHDIGKLVIDLSCIRKPGKLTDEEWLLIKKHPNVGANIIEPLVFLKREQTIIKQHHERIDGMGYPESLNGESLDPLTKILTVADSYDTMTSNRSYRENIGLERAVSELERCVDSQFDQEVVKVFVNEIRRFDKELSQNEEEIY